MSCEARLVHVWTATSSHLSFLAVSGSRLVLDQNAARVPELDSVLDGQRWAFEHSDLNIERNEGLGRSGKVREI